MGNRHSAHICPAVDDSGPNITPIAGSLSFHTISIIVAGAAAAFSCSIAFLLIMRHATHFSSPSEQKQIIRITTILPSFALISVLIVALDGSPAPYISGALDVGEAFPMAAFFLLMLAYKRHSINTPNPAPESFNFVERGKLPGQDNLELNRKSSIGVLQWLPVSVLTWIATIISLAAGTYCATSNSPHFAHIWITVIRIFSILICITSILRFYKGSKAHLAQYNVFQKLLIFKILVFLNFIQTFVFNFLHTRNHLHGTSHLTVSDLSTGIPALMLACETALVAPWFLRVYGITPYVNLGGNTRNQGYGGVARALIEAANIGDMVGGLVRGVRGQ